MKLIGFLTTIILTSIHCFGTSFCEGKHKANSELQNTEEAKQSSSSPSFTSVNCTSFENQKDLSDQNLTRAMTLADASFEAHFIGEEMAMARFFNPYTGAVSDEKGSIWMYTSAIEAVNAILHALKAQKENGNTTLYDTHFKRYADLLYELYEKADYYLGTFELVSYTQTKEWTVYGVNRGAATGQAEVAGIMNVYDDQMWLVREFIEAYKLTGKNEFLEKAEYLTEYVLDGWDCTFNDKGEENGGITWGPGYVSKHSCSNGPMVSPLVWLHEMYKGKKDKITHRSIDPSDRKTRIAKKVSKSDYYLEFAQKVYHWQKEHLLRADGVYDDMMGGCTPRNPQTELINGVNYRKGINCRDRVGPAFTYNSGTMLSGAADLFRATGDDLYRRDAQHLSKSSFTYFAQIDKDIPGYYSFDVRGFRNWFNGVLMRGFVDAHSSCEEVSEYINSFQQNLDYAYENFLYNGFLPTNLLTGWEEDHEKNKTEGMFNFAFAAEYAVLAKYELEKQ
ncbi:glycoside hydrolase family 76 protein [Draconibacterium sediminis]|uniref:glycoside hydrolase family 76 protein n=1 Tax=Draconibacterium sediminis TaxID=1544798 RepID=UPI0026EBB442|nr:glycoside hydrolase family 76 protein [Draconibacterium sediminis]